MKGLSLIVLSTFVSLASAVAADKNIYYILDASGSMWGQIHGQTKIEAAKSILVDRLPSWKAHDANVGLVVYGHRRKGDCGDIERVVELKPLNEPEVTEKINAIQPKGKTPIADAITLVAEELRTKEETSHVILISDGEETCHADPCGAVRTLKELGIDFTLDVIGFDITETERAQLECLAGEGGGRYFPVASAVELHDALQTAEETAPVPKVAQNVQIVLDRSLAMNELFGGRSKMAVAVEYLEQKLSEPAAEGENLSLRTFGGVCGEGDNTALEVPFGTGNGGVIAERIQKIQLEGSPTLAAALKGTVRDFSDPARFDEVARRAIVISGTGGYCDPMSAVEVHDLFRRAEIIPEVHLIAMDPPQSYVDDLERMVGAVNGFVYSVKTEDEFAKAMDRIFELVPVLSGVQVITEMLNGTVGHLNESLRNVEDERYQQAESEIAEGRKLLVSTSPQFRDLGQRQTRQRFRDLYSLASANREIQENGFAIAADLMDARRNNDITKYNDVISEWNEEIGVYNRNIGRIDEILKSLK